MTSKKNKTISELLSVIFLALLLSGQCTAQDDDVLFQVSTIDALMQGVFDGICSFDDLMEQGDFGIGTFDALEGEMIALDGKCYQVKADGVAYPVLGNMTAPFATVTRFEMDQTATLENAGNFSELSRQIDRYLPSRNAFYALRIDGTFPYVQTRSVPRQEKPYPRLAEAVENQSVFNFTNVTGSVVGVWAPDFARGVNVPGYHLHFITEDRKAGGHILEIQVSNATAQVDVTAGFAMQLPSSGDFYNVNLSGDLQEELERIEK
jgi:acetolactate decarboxylase